VCFLGVGSDMNGANFVLAGRRRRDTKGAIRESS
jgi:hypothetical protein